ncbi:glycoside hydrolase family 35 protein [Metabacillus halosaccharovorans]|uniref:glycoside hydrolase family 35 protein n=1 Tax=Metabacillus halosaccharovorans TaxID=930124 RepID=UPI001C1F3DF5|nr:beta-galactosidase family protein [Metabacillus halosaccharovorans]MBU7591154.1 beta-galactosidase [Metabacillus halosaccharovorans]
MFEVKDKFYIKGKETKIISGAIHYFRVIPEYWEDRLRKIKALGCNTIETYVAWNMHEPVKNQFNFTGICDILKFIKLAQKLDLFVILRPGPYICAEWEFGGLPAWLLKDDSMKLRSTYQPFLKHVNDFYEQLFKMITPLQIHNGGPIIMMQVENEYGYYGNNKKYLEMLIEIMKDNEVVVPIVTSDGLGVDVTDSGAVYPKAYPTYNCGSGLKKRIPYLTSILGNNKPLMCMEFWVGWFDSWGNEKHITRNDKELYKEFEDALDLGHVNIYMAHGGTNFGFMNGAIHEKEYKPHVTSYDYDALISENGSLTEKYLGFKKIISNHVTVDTHLENEINSKAYGKLRVQEKVSLMNTLEQLADKVVLDDTVNMEKLDQNYGYILYRSNLGKSREINELSIEGMQDRAKLYINNELIFTKYYEEIEVNKKIELKNEYDNKIDILVENMGRVNLGINLNDQRKGITKGVMVNKHLHSSWEHYCLPLDNVEKIDFSKGYDVSLPSFYKFHLMIDKEEEIYDTFMDLSGWGKGCVFINHFNLGRFWDKGPQRSLYVPAPLLKKGNNEIIIFETEGVVKETIEFIDRNLIG